MAGWLPLSRTGTTTPVQCRGLYGQHVQEVFSFRKQKVTVLQKYLAPSKPSELVQTERDDCETLLFPLIGGKI